MTINMAGIHQQCHMWCARMPITNGTRIRKTGMRDKGQLMINDV